jgi:predicted CXXCH cytochrome family protein
MKKVLLLSLCLTLGVLLAATSAMAFSGTWTPGTGINDTVHDMTNQGLYAPNEPDAVGGRICIYCHAPHNTIRLDEANGGSAKVGTNGVAPIEFNYLPLWNHQLTALAGTYDGYYNGTGAPDMFSPKGSQAVLAGVLSGGLEPGSVSLLCLSCHDGTVAVNSYGTGPDGSDTTVMPTGSYSTPGSAIDSAYAIGLNGNLQNHHPIGFDYEAVASADPEIRPSTTVMSAYNGNEMTIADHLFGPGAVGSCTGGLCLECASCHSVHNTSNTGERLLWRTDVNSQLCLTCHAKGVYTDPETSNDQALP